MAIIRGNEKLKPFAAKGQENRYLPEFLKNFGNKKNALNRIVEIQPKPYYVQNDYPIHSENVCCHGIDLFSKIKPCKKVHEFTVKMPAIV